MRGVVGICLLVAGCDRVFSLDRAFDAPDPVADADADARPVDAIDGPIDAAIDAPLIDAPASCPTSYTTVIGGHLYRFVTTGAKKTWQNAAIDCADDEYGHPSFRTHLAVLNTDIERSQIGAAFASIPLWIGFSDLLTPGFFRNVTTENTGGYPPQSAGPWAASQPDDGGDCVVKQASTANLDDRLCGDLEYYVCECDGFANTPSQYTP